MVVQKVIGVMLPFEICLFLAPTSLKVDHNHILALHTHTTKCVYPLNLVSCPVSCLCVCHFACWYLTWAGQQGVDNLEICWYGKDGCKDYTAGYISSNQPCTRSQHCTCPTCVTFNVISRLSWAQDVFQVWWGDYCWSPTPVFCNLSQQEWSQNPLYRGIGLGICRTYIMYVVVLRSGYMVLALTAW